MLIFGGIALPRWLLTGRSGTGGAVRGERTMVAGVGDTTVRRKLLGGRRLVE